MAVTPPPRRRLAYHLDGTRVFMKREGVYHELPLISKQFLNGDHKIFLTNRDLSPTRFYDELVFYFPEPTSLSAIYALTQTGTFWSAEFRMPMSVSRDTTTLDDGTWTDVGHPTQAGNFVDVAAPQWGVQEDLDYWYAGLYVLPFDSSTRRSSLRASWMDSFQYRAEDGVQVVQNVIINQDEPETVFRRGVMPLFGEDWENIRALKFTIPSETVASFVIHLFGESIPGSLGGVELRNELGGELSSSEMQFNGLTLIGDQATVLRNFRAINYSDKTAHDVTLTLSYPRDFEFSNANNPPYTTSLTRMLELWHGDGGLLVFDGRPIVMPLGDLAPGEMSDIVHLVRSDATNYNADSVGSFNFTLALNVGSWS